MPLTASLVDPAATLSALSDAIGHAKGGDGLAPVTVAVPTNTCGVMARRALGRSSGLVGVDMVTLNRLAELIAGPGLAAAGRSPMSNPVIDLAVARVLADDPGPFRRVASHPSTIVALRDLHTELRLAGPAAADRLADHGSRGAQAVRVSRAVTTALAGAWYDEADLLVGATETVHEGPPAGLGRLVLYLPDQLRGLDAAFVRTLAAGLDVHVVAPVTGDHSDATTIGMLTRLGVEPPAGPAGGPDDPDGPDAGAHSPASVCRPAAVVSTTDADDEVRIAVRHVLESARRGVPLERIAVLWPTHRPYARLVEHHLTAAGIPWNGRPGTSTTERLAPRFVLDLLDVDRRGLRRRALFDLLADVPARDGDGQYLPTASWERVSRYAGVARDDDWDVRLGSLHGHERWGESATGLAAFVGELRDRLGHPGRTRRWWDWAQWCTDELDRWVGRRTLDHLPDAEYRAWEALTRALDRLRHLDPVSEPVTRHRFRTTLEAELEAAPARLGRVGDGVTVGPLAGGAGLDVDVAVVLGASEGTLPPTPTSDPLLSDADRAHAGLPTADDRTARLRHVFRALLASSEVTVTVPRGDLRATAEVRPSRWLPSGSEPTPAPQVVDSHHAGLAATVFPVSPSEHRLRSRYVHTVGGGRVADAPGAADDAVLVRGLQLRAARRSDSLTVFDGDLSGVEVPRLDHTVSPTRLEMWSGCPHAYFVRHLLKVSPIDEPEAAISITALDRGSAHHDALDRFHRAVLDGELPPPGPTGWLSEHRDALARFFDEVCITTERRGRTGRPAFWSDERARMRADLLGWLDRDSEYVATRRATVLASEFAFGRQRHDAGPSASDGTVLDVAIELADGRRLQLEGSIDRVDRTAAGELVVTDHKTGAKSKFIGLGSDDPTAERSLFQLPAYAAAARAAFGDPDTPVIAEYGLMAKGGYDRPGYAVTPDVWSRVLDDVSLTVEGIEAGWFPNRPERPGWRMFVQCEYCDPDHLGTGERWGEWERKRHDPRLARWLSPPGDADEADTAEPRTTEPRTAGGAA